MLKYNKVTGSVSGGLFTCRRAGVLFIYYLFFPGWKIWKRLRIYFNHQMEMKELHLALERGGGSVHVQSQIEEA